jgi:hypothetical protein
VSDGYPHNRPQFTTCLALAIVIATFAAVETTRGNPLDQENAGRSRIEERHEAPVRP